MKRALVILVTVLLANTVLLNFCFGGEESGKKPVSREAIEKKYAFIDKHLSARSKQKLSTISGWFNDALNRTVVSSQNHDIDAMARNEAKKLFCICSDEQMDALVFHILITSLKNMETLVDVMDSRFGHTSTVYAAKNLKAFLMFETCVELYRSIKHLPASTVQDIP